MNKVVSIIIILGLIIAIGIMFSGSSRTGTSTEVQRVEVKEGVQYITVNAKGGYSPQTTNAKAGIPTKLIVKTNDTYDCSASLVIRSLGFQKILPQNGETEIDIGIPKEGVPLQGVCGMGMYSFSINFQS